ncbi:DUF1570 domain-containing protein [Aeoliella mucimassa]|uniref:DUF1570 domain-containing protein n=1 Tax=Aeoliella mucimassa TaxID=2527972 RepID=A0A518AVA2_9BACT|nr:DUF1570 domain-containing protein [Aeoliella mucimassa]QDU58667.1 hypothetical protein Pan181_49070 [Aeoliella mucimassa]
MLPTAFPTCLILAMLLLAPARAWSDEPTDSEPQPAVRVTFSDKDEQRTITGRVIVQDQEGGMLLEGQDGRRWVIEAANVLNREVLAAEFTPLTHDQLAEQTLAELPEGFSVHTTPHYVVCFNTSRAFAQWTSSLLERLHRAFTNYWENQGFEVREPEFPLVVIIYATADQYREASREELGSAAGSVIGYYNMLSNHVTMYDLTGAEAMRGDDAGRGSLKEINRMLTQPAAVPLVATVVHEATHQIAFNCGLQERLAEMPLWLVEGMAVYFEAPDLSSSRGWRGIGKVNYPRLRTFKQNMTTTRRLSVADMVADDKRFRESRTAVDAYADAWALNYYLIRYQPDQYVSYIQAMSKKLPLLPETPEARREEFQKHFGDIDDLERDFLKRMSRLK